MSKLGMAAVGAAAAYGLSRGRGRRAEAWRKPDRKGDSWAVWFGPGLLPSTADNAVEVEETYLGWTVSEYQSLAGYFDDADYEDKWSKRTTFVGEDEARSVREAAAVGVEKISYAPDSESVVDHDDVMYLIG